MKGNPFISSGPSFQGSDAFPVFSAHGPVWLKAINSKVKEAHRNEEL